MEVEYFVDSHCHMFTVSDIPLYRSTYALAERATLLKKLMVPFFSLIVPTIDVPKKVADLQKFMTFFENEPSEVCVQILNEISEVAKVSVGGGMIKAEKVMVTPLVMDFYDPETSRDRLAAQATRLHSAIMGNKREGVMVLPFLGVDPRRGEAAISNLLDNLVLGNYQGKVSSIHARENEILPSGEKGKVANGDFVGIKLYPSLGFDAFPKNKGAQEAVLAVYRLFSNRGLPVTVHCQAAGMELLKDGGNLGNPKKWQKALEKVSALRINFAHFGGEDGVKEMIPFEDRPEEGPGSAGRPRQYRKTPSLDSWTGRIVQMLKRYENTYADLSAFNFTDKEAVAALHWILFHDLSGDFNDLGEYSLLTKLLWGSDYPMPLKRKGGNKTMYVNLYQECVDALAFDDPKDRCDFPDFKTVCDPTETKSMFLRSMVCDNPKRFLGLG